MSADYIFAAFAASIALSGAGGAWVEPGNVRAQDGAYARVQLTASASSQVLDLLGVRPNGPGWDALVKSGISQWQVTTITAVLRRKASASGTIRDAVVQLTSSGSPVGNNLALTTTNWPTAVADQAYGGGVAIWSAFPTIQDLLDGKVGLRIQLQNTGGGGTALGEIDIVAISFTIAGPQRVAFPDLDDPAGELPAVFQASNTLEDLIVAAGGNRADALSELITTVRFNAYDEETGQTLQFGWTDALGGFDTQASDTPALTHFEPVLVQPLEFVQRLVGFGRITGTVDASPARIVAANGEDSDGRGYLDIFERLDVQGEAVEIRVGHKLLPYDLHPIVATPVIDNIDTSTGQIVINAVDRRRMLDASFLPLQYAGTGGAEGGADVKDRNKPFALGPAENISPVLIDAAAFVYQWTSNFPGKAVDAVRINGIVQVSGFTVDLTKGIITFAADPQGDVTLDVRGACPRNCIRENRDATHVAWTGVNVSVSKLAFSFVDGKANLGFRVKVNANNATLTPAAFAGENLAGWLGGVHSARIRKVTGVGDIKPFGSTTAVNIGTADTRIKRFVAGTGVVQGITFVNAGDEYEIDFWQYEPGLYLPSPEIDTTGASASVENYPDTFAACAKFVVVAIDGLVTFLDVDEASLLTFAQGSAARVGGYWADDTTVLDVLSELADSVLAWFRMDERGRFAVGRLGAVEAYPVFSLTEIELMPSSKRSRLDNRIATVLVDFRRNHTIQTGLPTAVLPEKRAQYERDYPGRARVHDPAIVLRTGNTADSIYIHKTRLADTDDAARLAVRLGEILKPRRRLFDLDTTAQALLLQPGQNVRVSFAPLTHIRGDVRRYVDGTILAKSIDRARGRVGLEVWG